MRHSLVCRDLLLDLRHHAPLWRYAGSRGRAGADLVLHVCRALSRDVRPVAGIGCWVWIAWGKRCLGRQDRRPPAESGASIRRALGGRSFLWVAVELARTRITAFPWELLGYSQTANFALTRIATLTGVYGLSFEIVLVNSVFAAAFLARPRASERKRLLAAAVRAAVILQAGQLLAPPPAATDHTALLVQPNIPIQNGAMWTREYFQDTLRDLTAMSLHPHRRNAASRHHAFRLDRLARVAVAVLHQRSHVSGRGERAGAAVGNLGGGGLDRNHARHARQ